jgi:hypothetical protein
MTFNDVVYRIKTTNEILNPLCVFVSDKEFLELNVKAVIGNQYNVPTISILRGVSEVGHHLFPERSCIKPIHAAG